MLAERGPELWLIGTEVATGFDDVPLKEGERKKFYHTLKLAQIMGLLFAAIFGTAAAIVTHAWPVLLLLLL